MRHVCPCAECSVDRDRGEPQYLARWPGTDLYWAPYGPQAGPVTGVPRAEARLFGPRHAGQIGEVFEIVEVADAARNH